MVVKLVVRSLDANEAASGKLVRQLKQQLQLPSKTEDSREVLDKAEMARSRATYKRYIVEKRFGLY